MQAVSVGALLRLEITKFIAVTRRRSESDLYLGRRAARRHHRSWPLLVTALPDLGVSDQSVVLHDASETGIGFRTELEFPCGALLAVKLFWHDPRGERIPALVRHCHPLDHGHLVGCEFMLDNEDLCEQAALLRPQWYER